MTTKKMMKELVAKGYAEKGQKLSDAEIKKLYNQLCTDEQETAEPLTLKAKLILEYPQLKTVIEDTFDYRIEHIDSADKMGDVLTLSGWDAGTPCSIGINVTTGLIEWDHNEERDAYEEKEECHMTKEERIKDTWKRVQKFQKTSDDGYVTREELVELFDDCMGNRPSKKVTRKQLVESLQIIVQSFESISVGDLPTTHDNTNHEVTIDDVWNIENANKVVHDVMSMAAKNRFVDYISAYMVRSAIRMVLFGKYSKEKVVDSSGKVTYYENIFTPEEDALADEFMKKFADKYLVQYKDDGKGYHINSLLMAWYYKKVVYRFKSKTQVVDYVVDYNGKTLSRKGTNQSWPLDDAAFKKFDDQCFFLYVCKQ